MATIFRGSILRRELVIAAAWVASTSAACYRGIDGDRGANDGLASDTSGVTAGGEGGSTGGDEPPTGAVLPAPPTIHRLTQPQLHNSYLALLGEPLALPAELPTDDLLYGFTSISAAGATISSLDAEKYEAAAYAVLDQVWADPVRRAALIGCEPTSADDPCIASFLETFATRAWRRPVTTAERDALAGLAASIAADLADVAAGIEFAAAAVLQSPHFLFRIEIGEPVPGRPELLRYTSWEMASRLSYLLHEGPPDDELLELAASGALLDLDTVEQQAMRLLEDDRARPALVGFFRDFMNIRKLDQLDRSVELFPQMSATMGPSMRVELERMFETTVFDGSGDFRELFTTPSTFVNEDLAKVYGIEGIVGPELQAYSHPEGTPRAGILTTAGFLAVNANKTQTSPTHRGRFVRIQLLCQDVPPPPAGVDTTLPEPDPTQPPQTLRQRLEVHRTQAACKGCHELMDPIGFALENYDAIGAHRVTDELNLPIDAATEVDGTPVDGPLEMAAFVAELPAAGACIARRFYEHGGAHLAGDDEEDAVQAVIEAFVTSEYDFKALVVALVTNDGFRYASVEEGT
ncbi:MAG: DUF1592 domain-containing protein [Deltaproteobacteria bacterium]|nr:DUF1592 domain-containing protein [Deltaproteobacteria bacterium]MBK8714188.1 DUF1592 domain-containing protein [Deltaproteobacteria bacterium]